MSNTGEKLHQEAHRVELKPMMSPWVAVGIQGSGYKIIAELVCSHYNVPIDEVFTKTRKRTIVWARQVIMYFCYNHIDKQTSSEVGFRCGGKDHATVLHACKTVLNISEVDKVIFKELATLEKKVMQSKSKFIENKK